MLLQQILLVSATMSNLILAGVLITMIVTKYKKALDDKKGNE
jgi:hypothetical protein